jgi:hypothetical protein
VQGQLAALQERKNIEENTMKQTLDIKRKELEANLVNYEQESRNLEDSQKQAMAMAGLTDASVQGLQRLQSLLLRLPKVRSNSYMGVQGAIKALMTELDKHNLATVPPRLAKLIEAITTTKPLLESLTANLSPEFLRKIERCSRKQLRKIVADKALQYRLNPDLFDIDALEDCLTSSDNQQRAAITELALIIKDMVAALGIFNLWRPEMKVAVDHFKVQAQRQSAILG